MKHDKTTRRASRSAVERQTLTAPEGERMANGEYGAEPYHQLRKLKHVWCNELHEDDKVYWRTEFNSKKKPNVLVELLRDKLKIDLHFDYLLDDFRDWVRVECNREKEAERMHDDDRSMSKAHPEWTLDQVRDEVVKRAYNRTLAEGDFNLGMKVARVHVAITKYLLDLEKHQLAATQRCYDDLPGLQEIRNDSGLSLEEKLRQIRLKLFGRIAEEEPQPQP
jgi:hypothetical protein